MALITSAQKMAMTKLAPGPAAATQSMSRFGFRNRLKSTGTGLAHPNAYLPWLATRIKIGITIVPISSI